MIGKILKKSLLSPNKPQPPMWLIYLLAFLFNFHSVLLAYIGSTYMEQFISSRGVSALYIIGSSLSILVFLFISHALRRYGNMRLTIWLSIFEIISLVILGLTHSPATAIIAFVSFLILNPLLFLNLDIFSETLIDNKEHTTGRNRGLILTAVSVGSSLAPLTLPFIVGSDDSRLHLVYFVAPIILVIFLIVILYKFRTFTDPSYRDIDIIASLRQLIRHKNLRCVFGAHLILQIFFSWTVIYMPLYLATEIGLHWDTIGYVTFFGLLAYALFEYPIGRLADNHFGEKEMMALGFFILAITVSWFSFMTTTALLAWALLLFVNRSGAALVETTTESYFFKHTNGSDAHIISFFRLTRPLGIIFGAIIGGISLLYLPFNLIFIVLGLIMALGIFFIIPLTDTK